LIGKKSIYVFILFFTICVINSFNISIAQQEKTLVYLDGYSLDTEISPAITNGRTFLPAREIVEALGGRITWFPALKLLNINMSDREVSVVMDVREVEVNGKDISLENPPTIIQDRVMLPLEVVLLLTDIEADWDKDANTLNLIRKRPFITGIRDFSHPDKTRVVLDISEKTSFNVLTLSNPERIVIDIDGSITKLTAEQNEILVDDYLVNRIRTGQFSQNTVRVVADLKNKYDYDVFELSSPHRIVLDVFMPSDQITQNRPSGLSNLVTTGNTLVKEINETSIVAMSNSTTKSFSARYLMLLFSLFIILLSLRSFQSS